MRDPMIRKKACRQCLCLDPAVYALFLTASMCFLFSFVFYLLSFIFCKYKSFQIGGTKLCPRSLVST